MTKIVNIYTQKIINNNIKNKQTFSEELSKIINSMKSELDKRVKDSRYSGNFAVNFEKGYVPEFYAKNVALFIEKDLQEEGKSYLGISVLHPTMPEDARTYLTSGTLREILEYLEKNNFKDELKSAILELSEELQSIR